MSRQIQIEKSDVKVGAFVTGGACPVTVQPTRRDRITKGMFMTSTPVIKSRTPPPDAAAEIGAKLDSITERLRALLKRP